MKLYLIKDMPYQGRILKAGKWVYMWDTSDAKRAISDGYAVVYEQRHLIKHESFTEATTAPEGRSAQGASEKKIKTKKNN